MLTGTNWPLGGTDELDDDDDAVAVDVDGVDESEAGAAAVCDATEGIVVDGTTIDAKSIPFSTVIAIN